MLIQMQDIRKSFGAEEVLKGVSAAINEGERIGMIGENGAGKTTLIKLICKEYYADGGELVIAAGTRIGYLEQNTQIDAGLDIWGAMQTAFDHVHNAMNDMRTLEAEMVDMPDSEELINKHSHLQAVIDSADGYNIDTQIKKVLSGMAFAEPEYEKPVKVLSGGEHTRLCLARILLQRPDVLILDEPTNHLDFTMMEWLEGYLSAYKGAVLLVSHDRYFLDSVCNRIFEMEGGSIDCYKGNYSAFLPQKEAKNALMQKQHDADVEKAKKLEDYVARNLVRASTTKMAQSRRKQLEKLDITKEPPKLTNKLAFKFDFDIEPYLELVIIKNLKVDIGERTLINSLSMVVKRQERLVIAGANGTGKSTLLRVLQGKLRPSGGMVRIGMGAKVSVYEQQQNRRIGTVESAIWDKYPQMSSLEVRSHLAKFSFRGEDVFKPCTALSGGELARLRFAEIMLERPNLMFLDEPTNHLDIYTRETLGNALSAYKGTLVIVTHDRYLMNSLACPILHIENSEATLYPSYDAMMHRSAAIDTQGKEATAPKAAYGKEQRRRKAELRVQIKELEDNIETLGADIVEYENMLNDPKVVCDAFKVRELCDELSDAKFHQDELYTKWALLSDEQAQAEL